MERGAIQKVKFDERGLIRAIVQDAASSEVVADGYLDHQSLALALQTGETCFPASCNPSAQRLNYPIVDVKVSSSGQLLTVLVDKLGGSAGKGEVDTSSVDQVDSPVSLIDVGSMEFGLAINGLYNLIADRRERRPEGSYTTYLFNSGLDKILKKIAEEAGEVIIASKNKPSRELVSELADLFYHLLVLMVERDVKLSDVHAELARRANSRVGDKTHHPEPVVTSQSGATLDE
ncbi:MAG TPA: phosphoribosyl-ATP diphosphatase [Blastocatellia bacterium]|nr:phosphoribosyl-ATP diphosphatase [Blastocatellia bacterium]